MTTFWYRIEAPTRAEAQYVQHLLRSHGLLYPWMIHAAGNSSKRAIRISTGVSAANACGSVVDSPLGEVLLTIDPKALEDLGLIPAPPQTDERGHGYMLSAPTPKVLPRMANPIRMAHFRGLSSTGSDWSPEYLLLGPTGAALPVVVTRTTGYVTQAAFAVDILAFMDESLLGPIDAPPNQWEDWSEAYGVGLTQSLAEIPVVDRVISVLRHVLATTCSRAFPVEIGRYPPGRSAPLLLTGDSDDATSAHLEDYLRITESRGAKATILLRSCTPFPKEALVAARRRGHCFGVHPYADDGNQRGVRENFASHLDQYRCLFGEAPCAVRNHRFQWVGRTLSVELEQLAGAVFDLNCVSANGRAWLGSASGVGFPVAFPPRGGVFSPQPLHLPTVLEDDVLQYSLDYCYQPFASGDSLPLDAAIRFLDRWVLDENCPAAVNLHPEHVTPKYRSLLDGILEWARRENVWTPSLGEFAEWMASRENCNVNVDEVQVGDVRVRVVSPTPVAVGLLAASHQDADWQPASPGAEEWGVAGNGREFRITQNSRQAEGKTRND